MISNKKTVKLNNFVPSLQFTENSFHDLVVYHCKTVFQAKSNKVKQNYFMLLASSPRLSWDMAQDRAPTSHTCHSLLRRGLLSLLLLLAVKLTGQPTLDLEDGSGRGWVLTILVGASF